VNDFSQNHGLAELNTRVLVMQLHLLQDSTRFCQIMLIARQEWIGVEVHNLIANIPDTVQPLKNNCAIMVKAQPIPVCWILNCSNEFP
jgi:hypothetical protein